MDNGAVTALIVLDLSTPLTMLHTKINRLLDRYGISGQAQILFSSYLKKLFTNS